jgi:translation initiation factor 1
MSKNKLVYSTNPNQHLDTDREEQEDLNLESNKHVLRVRLETKQRAGKKATIIAGYQGSDSEIETLAKTLKTKLGVGGSVKEGEIIIQGDYVQKVKPLLISLGYTNTK